MAGDHHHTPPAPTNLVPKYEVKLLLDAAKVLNSTHELDHSIKKLFKVDRSVPKMAVQFLDTPSQDIYHQGWIVRIRKLSGEPGVEITYKKRYKVVKDSLEVMLVTASQQGFTAKDDFFKAQIDWGFASQTLSINRDEPYRFEEVGITGMDLPAEKAAREMAIEKAPERFYDGKGDGDDWGAAMLAKARVYGPILAERYTGKWEDDDLDIEVWPIKDVSGTGIEYIVEVSFKAKKIKKAAERREGLMKLLRENGWLLERDSLKTGLIMERY